MKRKRIGIWLCMIGVSILLIGGYLILNQSASTADKEAAVSSTADTEEDVTEDTNRTDDSEEQNSAKEDTLVEQSELSEEESDIGVRQDSEQSIKEQKSAHEINSDVYEWPCGKEHFANMEEPEDVIYFAQNKELFDEIAKEFLEYEGKDVLFTVGMTDGELIEANNGMIEVKNYDLDNIKTLLQDNFIDSVSVGIDCVIFGIKEKDFNYLIYSFNDEISPVSTVNIAPHWWWQTGVGD